MEIVILAIRFEIVANALGTSDATGEYDVFGAKNRLDERLDVIADGIVYARNDIGLGLATIRQMRHIGFENDGASARHVARRVDVVA